MQTEEMDKITENIEKIDLRATMTDKIKFERMNRKLCYILDGINNNEYNYRNFNLEETWNIDQCTYFIESILLKCEIQPISLYVKDGKYTIIEGLQRIRTIKRFMEGKLKLTAKGLKKLHLFANKYYADLPEIYRNYLKKDCFLKIIEYKNESKYTLTELEEEYFQKQIYIRYNTGIRLKTFEIQKAQFNDDIISKKIKNNISSSKELKAQLISIGLLVDSENEEEIETNINKTMVKVRNLIALTYCPIDIYVKLAGDARKANEGYSVYVLNMDSDKVIDIFISTIKKINEIFNNSNYISSSQLKTYRFTESLYWFVSTIIKDKLINIDSLDINMFLDYCHKNNIEDNYFYAKSAPTGKAFEDRLQFLAKYLKNFHGIETSNYFTKVQRLQDKKIIDEALLNENIDDIQKIQYSVIPLDIKLSELMDEIDKKIYIFQPEYQRDDVINVEASSALIDSLLCNIAIPDILIYRYYSNGNSISEVVDGQQRSLSFASFMNKQYLNENREFKKSKKFGFALQNMPVFKDCNKKVFKQESKMAINKELFKRINEFKMHISIIDEQQNPNFSPLDHYVRINSNITPIKKHSFMMWNVSCDRWVVKRITDIASKYNEVLFKQKGGNKCYEQIITSLAYAVHRDKEYYAKNHRSNSKWQNTTNKTLTNYLNKITDENRNEYFKELDIVDDFLQKIKDLTTFIEMDLHTIFSVKITSVPSCRNYNQLYFLLDQFSSSMLKKKNKVIMNIVISFFAKSQSIIKSKDKQIDMQKEITNLLEETKAQLCIEKNRAIANGFE